MPKTELIKKDIDALIELYEQLSLQQKRDVYMYMSGMKASLQTNGNTVKEVRVNKDDTSRT